MNRINAINSNVHDTINITEYGIIIDIKLPAVNSGLYFRIYISTTPAYVISGVMIFVDESAILYAAATTSGVIELFTCYSIGTKIGPSNIHFELNPPTNRLINPVINIKPIISNIGEFDAPTVCKPIAPIYVIYVPKFV